MLGYYHSIERFGTVDGQGIRYVLFMSECNMRCRFCHNPDTWLKNTKTITVDKIITDLKRYRHFYTSSGGGITLSGGEPLLQCEFVVELLKACKAENINTTIDTAGYYDTQNLTAVLPYTDAVLFSIKALDPDKHKWLTGVDNGLILENLKYVTSQAKVTLRYVVIPSITNNPKDIEALTLLVNSLPKVSVELLPYHTYGKYKYKALNLRYTLNDIKDATPQDIQHVAAKLREHGINVLNCKQ